MDCCIIRTGRDIDWVVGRVLLGETVSVQLGGVRRPRRRGVASIDALCSLQARLAGIGAELRVGYPASTLFRLVKGRAVLAVPGDDGGDGAGVREPRRLPPNRPLIAARLRLPDTDEKPFADAADRHSPHMNERGR